MIGTINPRKTFAIISHPDAGKTTLTEKLLLFGGAIQQAGAVKARGENRHARSDWMKVEQERGISVASSVMNFEYENTTFNLLDTPGHEDFSEDTYRVLTAVDSAVMVLDSAKGIETQTKKLFEVCRLRNVPIITFINKLDREGLDPFLLLDDIEKTLALDVTPASWPIGMGKDFLGCYDLLNDQLILMNKTGNKGLINATIETCKGLDDAKLDALLPAHAVAKLREDVTMVRELCPAFDKELYLAGALTPVFFGSAINNFGVKEVLEGLHNLAPTPREQPAAERTVKPDEPKVTGFVFKIQANMDPAHRDRIAFLRVCSGRFERGMRLKHLRLNREIKVSSVVTFMASSREQVEEAYAGDIIGLPNHGNMQIGDSFSEGEMLQFTGIPYFAPEIFRSVRIRNPLKVKQLHKGLQQLGEEGAVQVFKPVLGSELILGAVGVLQFEVVSSRLMNEYGVDAVFEGTSISSARWVSGDDKKMLSDFEKSLAHNVAYDAAGNLTYLATSPVNLRLTEERWPKLTFHATREHSVSLTG